MSLYQSVGTSRVVASASFLAAAFLFAPISASAFQLTIEPDAQKILEELAAPLTNARTYSASVRADVIAYNNKGQLYLDQTFTGTFTRDLGRLLSRYEVENREFSPSLPPELKEYGGEMEQKVRLVYSANDCIWQIIEGESTARRIDLPLDSEVAADWNAEVQTEYFDPVALTYLIRDGARAKSPEKLIEERWTGRVGAFVIKLKSVDAGSAHFVVETTTDSPLELGTLDLIRIPETKNWAIESLVFNQPDSTKPMTEFRNKYAGVGDDFHPTKLTMTTHVYVRGEAAPALRESLTINVENFEANPSLPADFFDAEKAMSGIPMPHPGTLSKIAKVE